jgi:hypothetical protein
MPPSLIQLGGKFYASLVMFFPMHSEGWSVATAEGTHVAAGVSQSNILCGR